MIWHLFCSIDKLFRPNDKQNTVKEEQILLKNLRKCDTAWSTKKVFLRWVIDTVQQVLENPRQQ